MKKITIFLASSAELKVERERFEIEIYRKCKAWYDRGIFLHLEIWEDFTARMGASGSQAAYNKVVQAADLFVLLAYSKVGIYTAEEFEHAFGQFKSTQKPFIFTYFKSPVGIDLDPNLAEFQRKLRDLKHFYGRFGDANDLWNQFNKELDRLELADFREYISPEMGRNTTQNRANIVGEEIINLQDVQNSTLNISTGNTTHQNADKIYNIEKIEEADFT
jgi:hypothetical protein